MVTESLEQPVLEGQSNAKVQVDDDFHPNFASCSVEQLLSIPIQYIFQKTASSGKYIFSKSEVSTLLRVSMLASELDAILSLTYDALDRSHKCKTYRKYIEEANKHPKSSNNYVMGVSLRALLPILSVHLETADDALKHATSDSFGVTRILGELQSLSADLEKFSAMNYTMSEQLGSQDVTGISDDKAHIAEIEEAVVERIESLSQLTTGITSNQMNDDTDFTSMEDLCQQLFSTKQQPNQSEEEEKGADYTESQMFAADALKMMHGQK